MCISLKKISNQISKINQPLATSVGTGRPSHISILLIALIGFILTTVPIPKIKLKGNELECHMSASQWTMDGELWKRESEDMQI